MSGEISLPPGKWGVVFEEKGTASDSVYDQRVTVFSGYGAVLGTFKGSSTPNPFKPKDPLIKGKKAYPFVKPGVYPITHGFHKGKHALVVNNDGNVPTTDLNPNFPSQGANARYIRIHWGYSKAWKGSAGCPTIHPLNWNSFLCTLPSGQGFVIIP